MTQQLIPAVGYVRCSTEMQGDSPEQQKAAIIPFAESHGYMITQWFEDFGKSGTTFDERPEFQRLCRLVEHHPTFAAVICYDESRWGRAIDPEENVYWRFWFRKRGVDVVLVRTSIDPRNEYAPMLKAFESVESSKYSKNLSELTLRGAKKNGRFSNGGTAPYGYRRMAVNTSTGATRILEDRQWCSRRMEKVVWTLGPESEIETVRFIFAERARGNAYVSIAEKLNQRGVPCPRRGRWKNLDRKWASVTIKTILENPAYYGARVYNRLSMSKIQASKHGRPVKENGRRHFWKNPKSEWVVEEGAHEPIVTKEQWEAANSRARLTIEPKSNQHVLRSEYLLSGLIRCTLCGFGYQGQTTTAKNRPYPRYVDSGWQAKRVCSFFAIPKKEIEEFTISAIKETFSDPTMLQQIEQAVTRLSTRKLRDSSAMVDQAKSQLEVLNRKKSNLLDAISGTNNQVVVGGLLKKLEDLESEISRCNAQIQAAGETKGAAENLTVSSETVRRFMVGFEGMFEEASFFQKKLLLRKCVSRILVDRERKVARVYIRRLPDFDPRLTEGLKIEAPTTNYSVVGAGGSGDRT